MFAIRARSPGKAHMLLDRPRFRPIPIAILSLCFPLVAVGNCWNLHLSIHVCIVPTSLVIILRLRSACPIHTPRDID